MDRSEPNRIQVCIDCRMLISAMMIIWRIRVNFEDYQNFAVCHGGLLVFQPVSVVRVTG